MSHRPLYLGMALAALALSGPPTPLAAQDTVAKEMIRLENAWAAAEMKNDTAAVGALLAQDFIETSPDGALLTKAQVIQGVTTTKSLSEVLGDYQVQVYGAAAVVHGVSTSTIKTAGGTEQHRYRFTDTWVKQTDGRWLCVAGQSARLLK
jgi:ketosteroid isomerase-like protein